MKTIAVAVALFAAIGSGAVLAQGSPPGGAWSSSWQGYIETQRAQAMTGHRAHSGVSDRRVVTRKGQNSLAATSHGTNAGG